MMKRIGIAIALLAALWVGGSASGQTNDITVSVTETTITVTTWTGITGNRANYAFGVYVGSTQCSASSLGFTRDGTRVAVAPFAPILPYTLTGLTGGTRYCLTVADFRINLAQWVTTSPPRAAPGKVDAFAVVAGDIDFSLALSWTNPAPNTCLLYTSPSPRD